MPGFIKPQLATLRAKAPKGDQWLHEIKFDGYRIQVHLNRGRKKVFTRNGLDWTKALQPTLTGRIAGQPDQIFSAVNAAVSCRLPHDIRGDVMGRLILDILE